MSHAIASERAEGISGAALPVRVAFGSVLALAMATSSFPGYAFGVLGPQLLAEFDLSRVELGLLTTCFFLVGGALSLAAGRAVDRLGGRLVMNVALLATAGALAGMANASTYALLLAMAALAGVAIAAANPTTNKLVAVNLPPGRRGLTMGFKQAGVQVGAFLTGALLAPAALELGWRTALAWSVLLPVAAIAVAALVVPPDRIDHGRPGDPRPGAGGPLPAGVRGLAVYAFLMGSGVAAVNAYLPLYLVEEGGASPALAGAVVALIGLTGIVSRVMWGWGSERLRGFSLPLIALSAGAVVAIALIIAVQVAGLWVAWLGALTFGATAVTWNAVGMLAVLAVSGQRSAGLASGVVLTGFYIGFVGSPLVFGLLVDRTGEYGLAWALVAGIFALAALVVVAWQRTERAAVAVRVVG